ncbi:MAG: dTDP-4-dehydrorhamnose reductase [Candidatus Spechtbacterales bacterium]
MRVLLTGSGIVGTALKKVLSEFELYPLDRENLDISNKESVDKVFDSIKPELVINAAAYTNVDGAEENKKEAMLVNGIAVGYMAAAAKKHNALFVHYSTDYIFNGRNKDGYNEDARPAKTPLNVYGASKLLGEQELKKNTHNYYLIRTSWVFGEGGRDFVDTVLGLAEKGEMKIKDDEFGKPTYAKDLAQATRALVAERMPYGIYHITNDGVTSWYEYAKKIIDIYGKKHGWKKDQYPRVLPVSAKEFSAPAARPSYSILNNTKFVTPRPWPEALDEYLETSFSKTTLV